MDVKALKRREQRSRIDEREPSKLKRVIIPRLSDKKLLLKRVLDLFIVVLVLPVILPLASVVALCIKLDSRGPVLFKQKRVGYLGNTFTMYKFRSMRINAEENGFKFASNGDHRVTPFGAFIRKYRIDEVPQFWNVLKGDMSVIGPRPEQVSFVSFFNKEINNYPLRHSVKPGITGLAQVEQGYAACKNSTQTKLRYDLLYINNHSFKMEMVIIKKTMKTIMTGFGAR